MTDDKAALGGVDQRFTHKVYRCEWQVQLGTVDQYGLNFDAYKIEAFPTREEAVAFRPTIAKQHEHVEERWVPIEGDTGYNQCEIVYREVEVDTLHSMLIRYSPTETSNREVLR